MSVRSRSRAIEATRLIPNLLREHPEAREVLDRYGLRGCGGRLGPHETLRFFARTHGLDESQLLDEIDASIQRPPSTQPAVARSIADAIYRPYFLAAIAVVLTAGATWGAWILWNIGLKRSFLEVGIRSINAHGEAQIYGWVGLFIMGFAYQAFPRMWQSRLFLPALSLAVFALMVVGIALRTVGMVTSTIWPFATAVATLGGILQVVAACVFSVQITVTFQRSGQTIEPYVAFVMAALTCFVISTSLSTWHTWNTLTAANDAALIDAVATYQLPLRDLQVHGLALFMILGVSLRMLPGLFDAPKVGNRRAWWAFGLLVAGLLGEIALFLAYRWMRHPLPAAILPAAWLMMASAVGMIVSPWRLWRPLPEADRAGKFVRTAYAWLGVSLLMLLVMPLYLAAVGVPFSHAYFGATRHAITVGFISLMIMGMAAKVVPTLNGVDTRTLSPLWGPFLLVNFGCALRVTLQVLTDWTSAAFPLMGLSGTLEVIGLAWWGVGLVSLMLGSTQNNLVADAPIPRPDRIEGMHRVADVLSWDPQAREILIHHGFTALRHPILARTLTRQVTLAQAARLRGVALDSLLEALNERTVVGSHARPDSNNLPLVAAIGGTGHDD